MPLADDGSAADPGTSFDEARQLDRLAASVGEIDPLRSHTPEKAAGGPLPPLLVRSEDRDIASAEVSASLSRDTSAEPDRLPISLHLPPQGLT